MIEFNVGDHCIYPAHGVCTVKRIDTREVAGKSKKFYVLQVHGNHMTIMLPIDACDQVGVRVLMTQSQTDNVFKILRKHDVTVDQTTWNRRYREYMDRIKTGSALEIAEVARNLMVLRFSKDLSFGERKMLDYARELLAREIALVQGVTTEVALDKINRALGG